MWILESKCADPRALAGLTPHCCTLCCRPPWRAGRTTCPSCGTRTAASTSSRRTSLCCYLGSWPALSAGGGRCPWRRPCCSASFAAVSFVFKHKIFFIILFCIIIFHVWLNKYRYRISVKNKFVGYLYANTCQKISPFCVFYKILVFHTGGQCFGSSEVFIRIRDPKMSIRIHGSKH